MDALERLMAVPSSTSLEVKVEEEVEVEESRDTGLKEKRLAGGSPKLNRSHEAVLPFR